MASSSHELLVRFVEGMLDEHEIPGASVALFIDGEERFVAGVGSADLDRTTPLTSDACFYTYSITKTFIAIAIARLVDTGRLGLDDAIQTHLPELSLQEPVTVRRLLNHTSGIGDYGWMPEYKQAIRERPGSPWTLEEYLERVLSRGLQFYPGQGWAYSNVGYLVLKMLLEAVHGRPFRAVLQAEIFDPLGLSRTFVAETLEDAASLTPGYSTFLDPDAPPIDVTNRYHPGWVAHGVAISTALETAQIFEALFAGELVKPSSLDAMLEPIPVGQDHPLFTHPSYGLGLMIDPVTQHGIVAGHAGAGPGYSTAALHFSDLDGHRTTITTLTNTDSPDLALEIAFELAEQAVQSIEE